MTQGNIRGITGLRGLAAWLVVLYHFREVFVWAQGSWWLQVIDYGYLAVDLFFILSGLVIYINYHRGFERLKFRNIWYFYGKRLARIYPLHLTILLLYLLNPLAIVLFSSSSELSDRYSFSYYVLSLLLVQNWGFTHELEWNIPAWSISTEFAAYLLFPVLVWALKWLVQRSPWLLLWVAAAILMTLPAMFMGYGSDSLGQNISELGVYRCILEFALGLLLGYTYLLLQSHVTRIALAAFLCLLLSLGVALLQPFPLKDYLVAPAAFALLIVVFFDDSNPLAKLFGSRLPNYLGEISYSTYLVHYFVKDWVKFLSPELGMPQFFIYITCVFLLSVLLYTQIETRCRVFLYQRLSQAKARI